MGSVGPGGAGGAGVLVFINSVGVNQIRIRIRCDPVQVAGLLLKPFKGINVAFVLRLFDEFYRLQPLAVCSQAADGYEGVVAGLTADMLWVSAAG